VNRLIHAVEEPMGSSAAIELAGAKINLALHITGRRADGYHSLETLAVFADFGDMVRVEPSDDGRTNLLMDGPFAGELDRTCALSDNLAIRAFDVLKQAARRQRDEPVNLVLSKRIPIAAGLGGGSADAAAVLRLLDREWKLGLGPDLLAEIGVRLGADVPMCLASRPVVARGIGDKIEPVAGIPSLPLVLASPQVPIATRSVFAKLADASGTPLPPLPAKFGSVLDFIFWLRRTRNDLVVPARAVNKMAGAAATALSADPDCLFARMSGSGSVGFGIFLKLTAAERAAERLRAARPNWWIASATTGGS
jgi:4-diphosphocytidyl-2-C-methyl-D-erythritol kinase